MYLNLGDLGANIRSYVQEYQTRTQSNMNIESIADMRKFVEEYPEFRKLSGSVTKHVALVGELSRLVEKEKFLEVSELEQSLACYEQHNNDLKVMYLRFYGRDKSVELAVRMRRVKTRDEIACDFENGVSYTNTLNIPNL